MKLSLFILALLFMTTIALPQMPPQKSTQPKSPQNAPNEWSLRGRLDANPHDRETHEKLCALLEERGDIRASVKERWAWLGDNPDDWFELAQLMVEAEVRLYDPEYAIAAAKRYLSSNSNLSPEDVAGASGDLARLLLKRDRASESIPYLEAATKTKPDFEELWADLGDALIKTNKLNLGIEALEKAIDLDPSSPNLHVRLGDALAAKGDLTGQETEYKAACNLGKNDPLLANQRASRFVALAKLQIVREEYTDAEINLHQALQLDPNAFYAYLVHAQLLEKKGQIPKAQAERKRAESMTAEQMKKEKSSLGISSPLAVFVEDDPPEIVRILEPSKEHLVSIERMMLALAYFDLGRKDEGLALLDKFFEDQKVNTAQAHFTFAEALKKTGLSQKAEELYRKAYEMDPENTTYRYEYEVIRRTNSSSK
jgi:tetratricopeptide (TPR) repeat protein